MEIKQFVLKLKAKERGFHLVTEEVFKQIPELTSVRVGLLHLFVQHSRHHYLLTNMPIQA